MPLARYLILHLEDANHPRTLIHRLLPLITTGQTWDGGKPQSTVNIAFTHGGLAAFDLPDATLLTFPVEFQDTGANAPERWGECWQTGRIHVWLAINALTPSALEARSNELTALFAENGGVTILGLQDAALIVIDGKPTTVVHFGFTDGCSGRPQHANPPLVCSHLPNFVELLGGDYFFVPSITALGMLAMNLVDPR